jgi:hypothetical protein
MKGVRSMVFAGLAVLALYCVVRILAPTRPPATPTQSQTTRGRRETRLPRPRPTARPVEPRVPTGPAHPRGLPDEPAAPTAGAAEAGPAVREAQAETATPLASAGEAAATTATAAQAEASPATGSGPVPQAGKPPIQDPLARAALSLVGVDPDAELYWYEAINDPALPAQERQDLIEDLNEDGLSDPQNPTLDDLPLILSRIALIEEVFWDAMDDVNADAFLEAYKDLVDLADRAMGNG